ncbi:MAG: TatD family hydrolase [Candidatus Pacebacteria bacterium]|nr:TatD family hydrolase [Candidatus Paceibacterota bacterium]
MKYFDIHSHLNLKHLLDDQGGVIARMNDAGVGTITVGVDYPTSKLAIDLATKYENLYACVGLHPADNATEIFDYEKYLELAKHERVVAIGETGLDYFRLTGTDDEVARQKNNQKEIFIKHIELALEAGKPLMIHARPAKNSMDAYSDALDILESYKLKTESNNLTANFHFFVGDINIAKRIVKNSWTMSFDGPITFVNDYDEVIASIPIENIMAETDAPFAMPEPYRTAFRADPQSSGKTCEPHMVTEIYKKIAEIKNLDQEECRLVINKNVERVFGIKI